MSKASSTLMAHGSPSRQVSRLFLVISVAIAVSMSLLGVVSADMYVNGHSLWPFNQSGKGQTASPPASNGTTNCTYPTNSSCPHSGGPPEPNGTNTFDLNFTGRVLLSSGNYSYHWIFQFVAHGVRAQNSQLAIWGINSSTGVEGKLATNFTAYLTNGTGAITAWFDSGRSAWNGSGWNASFGTLGGWVSGANVTISTGDYLLIVTNQLLTWGPPSGSPPSWDDQLMMEMYSSSAGGSIQDIRF